MMDHSSHHAPSENSSIEYIKFGAVLAGILGVSTLIYSLGSLSGWLEGLRISMGVFMVTFAGFKLAGYSMFVSMFPMYDILAKRSRLYALAYPFIELALGAMHLFNVAENLRPYAVIFFMGIGAIGIINTVFINKQTIHCACLGNIIKLPLSTVSLAEDLLMVLMALTFVLFA